MARVLASDAPESAYANEYHGHPRYTVVFVVLLFIFVLSLLPNVVSRFAGEALEHTFVLALYVFVLAGFKAVLVILNFMHVRFEPVPVLLFLVFCVALLCVLFFGVAPDMTWIMDENTTITAGTQNGTAYVIDIADVKLFFCRHGRQP